MIRFEHVTRSYGAEEKPALTDLSVEFSRGEFAFLIGASGSGKSTLLRMILREGLPQQGKVTVAGQNLARMLQRRVPEYRRSIGMVFQDFRLLPDKTVYENVAFAMRVIGAPRGNIRKHVMQILTRVKLDHLAKRYPHEISGGEQQRAAIARAIINNPAIVLADEPTGNLDPRASAEVMKILRWINSNGTTVIMATHDRQIVDRMNRRVVQLHRGQLVRDEPRGAYDPPEGSQAWELLASEEAATGLRTSDPMPVRTEAVPVIGPSGEVDEAEELADGVGAQASDAAEGSAEADTTEVGTPGSAEPQGDTPETGEKERMKVRQYRVTWPEDEQASNAADRSGPVTDPAAIVPPEGQEHHILQPQEPRTELRHQAPYDVGDQPQDEPHGAPRQAHQQPAENTSEEVTTEELETPSTELQEAPEQQSVASEEGQPSSEEAELSGEPEPTDAAESTVESRLGWLSQQPEPDPARGPDGGPPAPGATSPVPRPVPRPRSSESEATENDADRAQEHQSSAKRGLFRKRRKG